MGELHYEISLQGQEVVDLCKICMYEIHHCQEGNKSRYNLQGRPVLWEAKEKPGALPRLLESTGPFQGINNGVTYLLAGMYFIYIYQI